MKRLGFAFLLLAPLAGCGGSRHGQAALSIGAPSSAAATTTAVVVARGPVVTSARPVLAPVAATTTAATPATPPAPAPVVATTPGVRANLVPANTPLKRLVLCLDGLAWRVVDDLQRRGRFKDFHPASRMVSTFPSLSNIAWSQLLDLPAESGYQALYFSNQLNKKIGGTSGEMFGSRFERRMHHRVEGLINHGLDYLAPFLNGKRNVRRLIEQAAKHQGSATAFAYALETDSCSHMRGRDKLELMLEELDEELVKLQQDYIAVTGRRLEIAIVSDHGHTLSKGKLVDIDKALEAAGYKVATRVQGPKDVCFELAGILSSVAIHCQPQAAQDVARSLARMDGADLCVLRDGPDAFRVISTRGEAVILWDSAKDAYAYVAAQGQDPLGYAAIYASLAAGGKVDQKGFALSKDLFDATIAHDYPDAPHRIRQGLTDLVRSPATLIVSLKKGHESGRGFVKIAAGIVGRNGTHGALLRDDSEGVFLANFMATPAAIRPAELRRHVDLADYKANPPSLELEIDPVFNAKGQRTTGDVKVVLRDDGAKASRARGETTRVRLRVDRVRFLFLKDVVTLGPLEQDEATLPTDGPVGFVVTLPGAAAVLKEDTKYAVHVELERKDRSGVVVAKEKRELTFRFNGTFQSSAD